MSHSARSRLSIDERANAWGFGVVFVVINLHVLRNIADAPYLATYALVSLWALMRAIARINQDRHILLGLPTAWIMAAMLAFGSTIVISGPAVAAFGLARYLFAFPIFLAFVAYTRSPADLLNHIRTMCFFFALGSLSIPLQYATGPIGFFDASSERAGLDRYASLFGSLTALGVAVGSYIALSHALRARGTLLTILLASVGGITSLSKAAIANIVLGLAPQLAVGGRRLAQVVATLAVVLAIGYFAVLQSPLLQESLAASATSFGLDGGRVNYDQSFQESIFDRLIERPMDNFEVLATLGSPLVYLTGGGFGMASTALVPRSASLAGMTHNQFAEFISVAGLLGGSIATLVILVILSRIFKLWRRTRTALHGAAFLALTLWVVNSFFANGTAYQPIAASILYAGMFLAAWTPHFGEGHKNHSSTLSARNTVKCRTIQSRTSR